VFCACEIVRLFSVVFFVFRAVGKFDFRLVVHEKRKRPGRDADPSPLSSAEV
jgi:hypothetical protein